MSCKSKLYYKMSDVSELLDVPPSTLRYWESAFPELKPGRTESGQRRYSQDDVELVRMIIHYLREEKLPLIKAQRAIANYRKYPPRRNLNCDNPQDALKHLLFVKSCTLDMHSLARIEAIETWLESQINEQ